MSEPNDNILPFRRKMPPLVWSDGRIQDWCDELVHVFASVPGRCQCGERIWETAPGLVKPWVDQPGVIIGDAE